MNNNKKKKQVELDLKLWIGWWDQQLNVGAIAQVIFLKWNSRDKERLEICKTKKTRAGKVNSLQKLLVVVMCFMYKYLSIKN